MLINRKSVICKLFVIFSVVVAGLLVCKKKPERIDITTSQIIKTKEPIPLEVTHLSPVGSVEGFRETFKILVGFNQTMVALQSVPRDETSGPLEFDPPIKGKFRWMGSRTLAFIPEDTLQPATRFTATLKKDKIQSLTGMRLERDTSWTFESVRPQLLSSSPYNGYRFLDTKSYFYLKFNMRMDPGRVGDGIKVIAHHGQPSYVYCGRVEPSEGKSTEEIPFEVRHLKDYEKKDWPLKSWKNEETLVLIPGKDLPKESEIKIFVKEGLLGGVGNLGSTQERRLEYNTYNYFGLLDHSEEIAGDDPLKLCFSNPVKMKNLIKNLKITPQVEIPEDYLDANWGGTSISLYLPFKTNTSYRVEIKREVCDNFDNPLDRDYSFRLEVGDYEPNVDMPTWINLVESNADRRFPVMFTNVDRVRLRMGIVSLNQAVSFLKRPNLFGCYKPFYLSGFFTVDREWHANTFKRYRNKKIRLPIKLDEVLGARRAGLVFIELDNRGQRRYSSSCRYQKAFLEVGNLGVTWKYAPENNLVFVTRLDNTEPVSRAKVQFRSDKNQILWEGFTDRSGFCEFPGWATMRMPVRRERYEYESEYEMESYSYRQEPNFWLTIAKGQDQAVYSKNWNFGIDLWRFDISYQWQPPAEEYYMFLFTEKGLYKSGETVHIKGILRKKQKGRWILPDIRRIKFVVHDARDEEIVNDTLRLNSFGAFNREVPLTAEAVTGVYSINVNLLKKAKRFYHYFRVEAYKPAEFEVKTTAERDTFIAGEDFVGTVTGRYLFGMPMTDADCSWSLYRDRRYLSYPRHQGYRFGYYDGGGEQVIGSGEGKTDKEGNLKVKVRLSRDDIKVPSVLTLEGTVTAPNKRSLSGRQNWPLFNANLLVGMKRSDYLYILDDTVRVNLITVRTSGEMVGDKRVNVTVVKREWKSIKKARTGGRYEWVSERVDSVVAEGRIKSRLDSVVYQHIPDRPGYYYCDAVTKDEKGRESKTRIFFYVAGRGYCGWEMRDDDMVELVADKDKYQVGDTARILVKSPYDSAQALITVERELVLRKWTQKIYGNAAYIEVPIRPIDLPNTYVCVMLYRGRTKEGWDEEKETDLGKPQFKIGYVNLKVDSREKQLKVVAWSDTSNYRPRDSVTVFYNVKDHKGRPVKNCEVALFVVDVGVLNLIAFQTPNPFDYFYGSRSLFVKTIESRLNILGERDYGEKGEERGGGGAPAEAERDGGVSYRQKFIATVFYKGNLKTDKDGNGRVKFQLPDNLTKFRIMAVAQTKRSQFGSGDSTFVVNLPFILTASIPRFSRVGDRFKAGVVLHNRTDKKHRSTVDCLVEGLELIGDEHVEVDLPPNTSKEVRF
ncbi:MAG TPA: hypothetical protein EYP58_05235, partial [bacterium (Candidatus Stahlbacteria)]|nr:hypothetical protein [Candidatus Stahlbacteria bacterium]